MAVGLGVTVFVAVGVNVAVGLGVTVFVAVGVNVAVGLGVAVLTVQLKLTASRVTLAGTAALALTL